MECIVRFRDGGVRARLAPRVATKRDAKEGVKRTRTVLPENGKGLSLKMFTMRRASRASERTRARTVVMMSSATANASDAVEAAHGDDAVDDAFEDAVGNFVEANAKEDEVEVIHLQGEVVVDDAAIDAREAWKFVKPLLCPADDAEASRVVETMSSMLSCMREDVVNASGAIDRARTRLKQVSRWRHSALIRGKSTTVVDVEPNDEAMSLRFDVVTEACRHQSVMAPTLRSYSGETTVVKNEEGKVALRMTGMAKVSKASSYTTRLVRDVMVGAMRSQMESSLADLQRVVRDARQ